MKPAFKSLGIMLYFIIIQIVTSIGLVVFRLLTNADSFNLLYECLETNGALSAEYLKIITEMVIPAAMIGDILAVIPIIIISICKGKRIYKAVKPVNIIWLIGIGISLNLITSGVVSIIPQNQNYNDLMSVALNGGFAITLLASGIVVPIVEEIIFRFCICGYFSNKKIAMIISAVIFGLAHMNIIQSSYAFVLGLILAGLYIKTNNLIVSTIVHLTINISSVIYEYLPVSIKFYVLSIAGIVLVITVCEVIKVYLKTKNKATGIIVTV